MTEREFKEKLRELSIEFDDNKLRQLDNYYNLLAEYNKVMNLTRIIDKKEVYLKHFYDSLTIVKTINLKLEENLCDIGTGAGFPGIVIKIFFPHLKVTLIDSLNKRIQFLNIVIEELDLKEIEAIHSRIEDYGRLNQEKFDVVTSRAVAQLNILLEYAIPILKLNKYFIAMKGKEEKKENYTKSLLKLKSEVIEIQKFKLPNEESDRTIYKFQKKDKTNKIFPRKYSEIKKRPL